MNPVLYEIYILVYTFFVPFQDGKIDYTEFSQMILKEICLEQREEKAATAAAAAARRV